MEECSSYSDKTVLYNQIIVLLWPISYSIQLCLNNGSVKCELCMYVWMYVIKSSPWKITTHTQRNGKYS
jgi:hypothetical protein